MLRFIAMYEYQYMSTRELSFIYVETMTWSYKCWRWQLLYFLPDDIKSVLTKTISLLVEASILELLFQHYRNVFGNNNLGKEEI